MMLKYIPFGLLVSVSLLCSCSPSDAFRRDKSIAIGDRLIAAIESYKVETGSYPQELDQLIPEFINEIEDPTYGACEWDYQSYRDGSDFRLSFHGSSNWDPSTEYGPKIGKWQTDTK